MNSQITLSTTLNGFFDKIWLVCELEVFGHNGSRKIGNICTDFELYQVFMQFYMQKCLNIPIKQIGYKNQHILVWEYWNILVWKYWDILDPKNHTRKFSNIHKYFVYYIFIFIKIFKSSCIIFYTKMSWLSH